MSVKTSSLDTDTDGEMVTFIGKLVDANHPLRDIERQHRDQLLRSLRSCEKIDAWRIISVVFKLTAILRTQAIRVCWTALAPLQPKGWIKPRNLESRGRWFRRSHVR